MDIGTKAIYIVLFLQICILLSMLLMMDNFHSNLVRFSAYCWGDSSFGDADIVMDEYGNMYVNMTPPTTLRVVEPPHIVFPN